MSTSLNTSSASTSGATSGSNPRRERGAVAAQACETCRHRKVKCDEERPKCGLCDKAKIECIYRVPQPTKKDRTLVEILNRLKNIENRLSMPIDTRWASADGLSQATPSSELQGDVLQQSSYASQLSQQLGQSQPPLLPLVDNNGGSGGSGGSNNNLLDFQGNVWSYVKLLEAKIAELQERLETVERERDSFAGRLIDNPDAMDI